MCLVVTRILQVDLLLRCEWGQAGSGATARVMTPIVMEAEEGFRLGQEGRECPWWQNGARGDIPDRETFPSGVTLGGPYHLQPSQSCRRC